VTTSESNRRVRLSTVLGLREGAQSRSHEALTALHKLSQKPQLYAGLRRSYQSDSVGEDGRPEELPGEFQKVQLDAEDVLTQLAGAVSRFWDVQLTMDDADTKAFADVVVTASDGTQRTLLERVPVTTLLFLEKRLTDVRTFVKKLPVLDPEHDWTKSEQTGLYETRPVLTARPLWTRSEREVPRPPGARMDRMEQA